MGCTTILKLTFTFLTWASLVAVAIVLGEDLGSEVVAVLFLMGGILAILNGFVWNWGQVEGGQSHDRAERRGLSKQEKRKRDRLDAVLRDLSDEQLYALKQRLRDDPDVEDRLIHLMREEDLIDEVEASRRR